MKNRSRLINVSPSDIPSIRRSEQTGQIHVNIYVSPYDIPESVYGEIDEERGTFTIRFNYIQHEPSRLEQYGPPHVDAVRLRVGKNSGRLHAIEMKLADLDATSLRVDMARAENAIDRYLGRLSGEHPSANIGIAKGILRDHAAELFEP